MIFLILQLYYIYIKQLKMQLFDLELFDILNHALGTLLVVEIMTFDTCHFALFPFGLVIRRELFASYTNHYTDCSILMHLLD